MNAARRKQHPAAIPLDDRLPTFRELATFDAGNAWDRLTPAQQREIGTLAVRFGTIGQCEGYFRETLQAVQTGYGAHWSPEVQATAVWPRKHIDIVESVARQTFQSLCDHFDPLWPQLFGWTKTREARR